MENKAILLHHAGDFFLLFLFSCNCAFIYSVHSQTYRLTLEFNKLSKSTQRSDTISAAERYGGLHFPNSRPTIKLNSTRPAVCLMGRKTIILTICRKICNLHRHQTSLSVSVWHKSCDGYKLN